MKLKSLLFLVLCGIMMAGFSSCDDEEDNMPWNDGATVALP